MPQNSQRRRDLPHQTYTVADLATRIKQRRPDLQSRSDDELVSGLIQAEPRFQTFLSGDELERLADPRPKGATATLKEYAKGFFDFVVGASEATRGTLERATGTPPTTPETLGSFYQKHGAGAAEQHVREAQRLEAAGHPVAGVGERTQAALAWMLPFGAIPGPYMGLRAGLTFAPPVGAAGVAQAAEGDIGAAGVSAGVAGLMALGARPRVRGAAGQPVEPSPLPEARRAPTRKSAKVEELSQPVTRTPEQRSQDLGFELEGLRRAERTAPPDELAGVRDRIRVAQQELSELTGEAPLELFRDTAQQRPAGPKRAPGQVAGAPRGAPRRAAEAPTATAARPAVEPGVPTPKPPDPLQTPPSKPKRALDAPLPVLNRVFDQVKRVERELTRPDLTPEQRAAWSRRRDALRQQAVEAGRRMGPDEFRVLQESARARLTTIETAERAVTAEPTVQGMREALRPSETPREGQVFKAGPGREAFAGKPVSRLRSEEGVPFDVREAFHKALGDRVEVRFDEVALQQRTKLRDQGLDPDTAAPEGYRRLPVEEWQRLRDTAQRELADLRSEIETRTERLASERGEADPASLTRIQQRLLNEKLDTSSPTADLFAELGGAAAEKGSAGGTRGRVVGDTLLERTKFLRSVVGRDPQRPVYVGKPRPAVSPEGAVTMPGAVPQLTQELVRAVFGKKLKSIPPREQLQKMLAEERLKAQRMLDLGKTLERRWKERGALGERPAPERAPVLESTEDLLRLPSNPRFALENARKPGGVEAWEITAERPAGPTGWLSPDGKVFVKAVRFLHDEALARAFGAARLFERNRETAMDAAFDFYNRALRDGWVRKAYVGQYGVGKLTDRALEVIAEDALRDFPTLKRQRNPGITIDAAFEEPGRGMRSTLIPLADFVDIYEFNLAKAVRDYHTRWTGSRFQPPRAERGGSGAEMATGGAIGATLGGAIAGYPGVALGFVAGALTPATFRALRAKLPSALGRVALFDREMASKIRSGQVTVGERPKDVINLYERYLGSPVTWWSNPNKRALLERAGFPETVKFAETLHEGSRRLEQLSAQWKERYATAVKDFGITKREYETEVVPLIERRGVDLDLTKPLPDVPERIRVAAEEVGKLIQDDVRAELRDAMRARLDNAGLKPETVQRLIPDDWGLEGYYPHGQDGNWILLKQVGADAAGNPKWDAAETGWRFDTKAKAIRGAKLYLRDHPDAQLRVDLDARRPATPAGGPQSDLFDIARMLRVAVREGADPLVELQAAADKASVRAFGPKPALQRAFGAVKQRKRNLPGWARDMVSLEEYLERSARFTALTRTRGPLLELRNTVADRLDANHIQAVADAYRPQAAKMLAVMDHALLAYEGYPTPWRAHVRGALERRGLDPMLADKVDGLLTSVEAVAKLGLRPAAAILNKTQLFVFGLPALAGIKGPKGAGNILLDHRFLLRGIKEAEVGMVRSSKKWDWLLQDALGITHKGAARKMDLGTVRDYAIEYERLGKLRKETRRALVDGPLWMFTHSEWGNQASLAIASYLKARHLGLGKAEAVKLADMANNRANFADVYKSYGRQDLLRRLPRAVAQFKTFPLAAVETLFGLRGRREWLAFAVGLTEMGALALPFLGIFDTVIEATTGWSPISAIRQSDNKLVQTAARGIPGMLGVDMTRSVEFTDVFSLDPSQLAGPLANDLYRFGRVAPGLLNDLTESEPGTRSHEEAKTELLRGLSPEGTRVYDEIQRSLSDDAAYKDPRTGNTILSDLTAEERTLLFAGFTPVRISRERERHHEYFKLLERHRDKRAWVVDTYASTLLDKSLDDTERTADLQRIIRVAVEHDPRLLVNFGQALRARLRNLILEQRQRDLRRAPAPLRPDVLELDRSIPTQSPPPE